MTGLEMEGFMHVAVHPAKCNKQQNEHSKPKVRLDWFKVDVAQLSQAQIEDTVMNIQTCQMD